MSGKEKRYFWLKLKNDFFNQKEIKMLRRLAGGDTFTIIYLKILLLSLQNNGKVYYDGIAENIVNEIALEIDEDIENAQVTFNYLQKKGLLVFNTDDEIELSDIHSMIGSESASASRVRKHRVTKAKQEALQSNDDVTVQKRYGNTELEKELEIELEIELEVEAEIPKQATTSANPFQLYQENFGVLNSFTSEDIQKWIEDLGAELVVEALKRAALEQKSYRYAQGILKDWAKRNIDSMEKVHAQDVKHQNDNRPYKKNVRKEVLPEQYTQPSEPEPENPELMNELERRFQEYQKGANADVKDD